MNELDDRFGRLVTCTADYKAIVRGECLCDENEHPDPSHGYLWKYL